LRGAYSAQTNAEGIYLGIVENFGKVLSAVTYKSGISDFPNISAKARKKFGITTGRWKPKRESDFAALFFSILSQVLVEAARQRRSIVDTFGARF
jgi:hypothetical protein